MRESLKIHRLELDRGAGASTERGHVRHFTSHFYDVADNVYEAR